LLVRAALLRAVVQRIGPAVGVGVISTLTAALLLAGSAAALYNLCRTKAATKALKKGEAPDYTKCDLKFAAKWQKVEDKGGGECWTAGDEATVQSQVTVDTDDLGKQLTACGDAVAPMCNGTCPFDDPCVPSGDSCICF
jgi:hypothetical protein